MRASDLPFYIFASIVTMLTLVVVCAIGHLLYTHFREQFAAWRNAQKFAAELPEGERAAFWRVYKQRRHARRTA